MKRSEEIRSRQAAIKTDLEALEGLEEPTEEDSTRSVALLDEWDTLSTELAPLAEREARVEAVRSASVLSPSNVERATPDVVVTDKSDPYENVEAVRNGLVPMDQLRLRASRAVEQAHKAGRVNDAGAERALGLVEKNSARQGAAVASHYLTTGSDAYQAEFQRYLADPEGYASRAALSLTSANGGYLVPFTLDPTVILTNSGSMNPWRQISTVKTTATNTWNGVSSAGVSASWLAEGTEAADASPTFGNLAITPQKASAWVYGSYEVLEDSDFAASLPMMLADAKDRLEEAAFATGTGSGQPKGVITAATTTVTAGGTAAYAVADLYALTSAVPARFRGPGSRPAIVANLAQINRTRAFDTAGGASLWTNLGDGSPERVLGWPLYESTTMSGVLTTGAKIAVAGDFSQFYIVDRIGMSVLYEPMVKGANQRPTGQAGWFAFWRVGSDAAVPGAFRVLVTG